MTTQELRKELKRIEAVIEKELSALQGESGTRLYFEVDLDNIPTMDRDKNAYKARLSATAWGSERL